MFESLSSTKSVIIRYAEGATKYAFTPRGGFTPVVGQAVKLSTTSGEVAVIEGDIDFPYGIVVIPKSADGTTVTVLPCNGNAEILALADGTVESGDLLSITGVSDGLNTVSATGEVVSALCVKGGTTEQEVIVQLLQPYTRPA